MTYKVKKLSLTLKDGAASYAKIADKFSRDFKNLNQKDLAEASIKPAIQKLGRVSKTEASSQLKSIEKSLQKIFKNTYQSLENLNEAEAVNKVLLPGLLARSNLLFDDRSRSLLPSQNRKTLIADLGRMIELEHTFQDADVEDLLSLFRNLFPTEISGEYYQLLTLAEKIQFNDDASKNKFLEGVVICDNWKGSLKNYREEGQRADGIEPFSQTSEENELFLTKINDLLDDHLFSKINACIGRHEINTPSDGRNAASMAVKVFSLPHFLQMKLEDGTATLEDLKKYQEIRNKLIPYYALPFPKIDCFEEWRNFSKSTAHVIVEKSIKALEKELKRAVKLNLETQDALTQKIETAQEILPGLDE